MFDSGLSRDAGTDGGVVIGLDAGACGALGTNCRTTGPDTCGAGLMCWTSSGRTQGVCAPSDMCGFIACTTLTDSCLQIQGSSQGTCVTRPELACVCSTMRGRNIFDCSVLTP